MKVLLLLAVIPFAVATPQGYAQPAPPPPQYQPAPPPPAYGGYQPEPSYGYGYEEPKHNCSVSDVVEPAEVCTPTLETKCENVDIAIKKIVEEEVCFDLVRTVCTESSEEVPNEVCSYNYNPKKEKTTGKSVDVTFKQESNVQMVTVCTPGYGPPPPYGYEKGYGYEQPKYSHQVCKEVAQTTTFNVPVVTPKDVEVEVTYPEAVKECVQKPILLPRSKCESVTEKKCGKQPVVQDATESVEKCTTTIGAPQCQKVELTLPKQTCIELITGYVHDPAPKAAYPEQPKYAEPPKAAYAG